ncbi:MAG TPA: cell wall biosynthesis glycosyltransferase [Bryobacteraceae bacterium]|nr:cell wall biosynthesis glycosyltransferase [Bryobacteraceae bacterium]
MAQPGLPGEALRCLNEVNKADIVIGIPSYNNARTIAHVVRAAQAGLSKYFPQYTSLIVNSDGGSTDGTRDQVLRAEIEESHLLLLTTPLQPVHRLAIPYDGIPGKGSAFRLIFELSRALGAQACAVVDADLRSITPEWISLLVRPILYCGHDFVAPYYHRHKFDGTITNSIVYPLTRALYGRQVRQPIGGDFGISGRLVSRYLERDDWETDVARFGIDIWLTTIALAEGYRVCQSFLGAKLHDAKDPGADLSAMLHQVVGSVFQLMAEYERQWQAVESSSKVDLFGFRFDVGLEPIAVNVERMIQAFLQGCDNLPEVWALAMQPAHLDEWLGMARRFRDHRGTFVVEDELWVRTIHDFACAHRRRPLERSHLLRSLTPLYLARVASFVRDTWDDGAGEVEDKIERLCRCFEREKPALVAFWNEEPSRAVAAEAAAGGEFEQRSAVEMKS